MSIDFIKGCIHMIHRVNNGLKEKSKEEKRLIDWLNALSNNSFNYEKLNGINVYILERPGVITRKFKKGETYMCLFCGHYHIHGLEDGLRASHCDYNDGPILEKLIHTDGTVVFQKDGYIIKTEIF